MAEYILKKYTDPMGKALSVVSEVLYPSSGDRTGDIQAAIDRTADNGGGVVWLEAGHYELRNEIEVRTAVILSGAGDPTGHGDGDTVLECFAGRGEPDGKAQITLRACAGVRNLVIYYPEQSIDSPVPYSPAVRQHGTDSANCENVIMVNPWRGFQSGPDANELHFIKNVRMTPLESGVYMDMTTDIGRLQNIRIAPDYYADYTGTDVEKVREYMLSHTIGVFMARSDWEYVYGIDAEYCMEGMRITLVVNSGPNAQVSHMTFRNCRTGIRAINVNPYGIALSDTVFDCDRKYSVSALRTEESFDTLIQLAGVDFLGSCSDNIIEHLGSGQLSLADCMFDCDAQASAYSANSGISFVRCDFRKDIPSLIADKGDAAALVGCSFAGEPDYRGNVIFSDTVPDFPKAARGGQKPYPKSTHPAEYLYNVLDFGAVRDGRTDSADAVEKAVSEAGKTGGIVFFPGGWYIISRPITVPTGVELRGVFEQPCHTMGGGSVIMSEWGRGDENAEALITLSAGSGVRGILFYNPEQSPAEPVPYPFAVRSTGENCYVINDVFINSWQGVDMMSYPSAGHYVSYISGAPIHCGVALGSNCGEGWIENIQYNPHYWFRSKLPNSPDNNTWKPFWYNQMKLLDALKFGYNADEHLLGTFVFAAHHGIGFELQDGKGTSGLFIGHGTDSGLIALYLGGCEKVDLLNTQLVNIEAEGRRSYIYSAADAEGEFSITNTLMWGDPHYAAYLTAEK